MVFFLLLLSFGVVEMLTFPAKSEDSNGSLQKQLMVVVG
jgi:hypothetical protein